VSGAPPASDLALGSGRATSGLSKGMTAGSFMSEQAGYIMFFVMLRFSLFSIHWLARAACAVDLSILLPTCAADTQDHHQPTVAHA
jgi:hypothetical protein